MKLTIKEIAEMAGVHRATVDKVLHNRVGVSDEVRARVQSIIDQVGYVPNPAGRALQKQGKVYRIAAVLVDVDAKEYLIEGIKTAIAKQAGFDFQVSYYVTRFQDIEAQRSILEKMIEEKVDGIILSPIYSKRIGEMIDRAQQLGIPVVTINSDVHDSNRMYYIGHNAKQASRVAGRMLGQFIGGEGELAIITSSIESENNNFYVQVRESEFSAFVKEEYPNIKIVERIESLEDRRITYQKTLQLLEEYPHLKGIYITCGGAAEVGRAIKEKNKQHQVKILSFEDYPEILELMKENVIDCTLSSDLQTQGELPVTVLVDYLVYGKKPKEKQFFTEIRILVKENIQADETLN